MTTAGLGIDVAKKDFCLATSQKPLRVLANTNEGFHTLIELLSKYDQPHVILEASGGYERALTDALHDAGITVSVVQPGCVRHFAKSLKVLAKTDAIDAAVLARFGEATQPKPTEKTAPATRRWRALADRRTQLVEDRTREKNRHGICPDRAIAQEIRRRIKQLTTLIEKLDRQVQALIAEEEDLLAKATALVCASGWSAISPKSPVRCDSSRNLMRCGMTATVPPAISEKSPTIGQPTRSTIHHRRFRRTHTALQTATGVGTQTACILLAHFPELGTLSRQAVAAIAGVAPHPQESGKWVGQRRIYGGRKVVRKALDMAAKSAAQHCPHLAPFDKKLRAANKPDNVALIAVARKLLIRLNPLLKHLKIQPPNATLAT